MKKIIIAIDGPAGSGKSTTAKIVAEKLGYIYVDSGAMYRAVALDWMRTRTEMTDENLLKVMEKIEIALIPSTDGQKTILRGEDVSKEIRTPEVTKYSSPVSAISCVREKLVDMQRELGNKGGIVMDGRDIGTVVFPHAELKIFLIATVEERAKRRYLEMKNKNQPSNMNEIMEQIKVRDFNDSTRNNSPLCKADDAIEIDTSNMTIEQQCYIILDLANIQCS